MGSYVLLILTSILSSSLLPVCPREDTIAARKSISFNQTIISAGGNFALGFFSPGNSTNSYLGVWYNTIPKHTLNRENPILEENSHAVLALSSSGNLMLLDGRREVTWSTNVSAVNLSVNSATAVLNDSGNFVLKQDEHTVLWQSFDYPTDTFMSGMKISLNRKTGLRILLTSWANDEDPRPGMFSIGIDPKRRPQVYIWKQHDPYWRSNVYYGTLSMGGYFRALRFTTHLTFVVGGDEFYLSYSVSDDSIKLKFTITPSGQTELLFWQQTTWQVIWRVPETKCDFYGYCGPFGGCEQNGSTPLCKCLTGFEPKFKKDWVIGNWTRGAVRRTALRCDKLEGFMKFERMKFPDYSISLGNMSISECEFKCLSNCSCTAYCHDPFVY